MAPLAATLAVGTPDWARVAAAATLRDLDFPVRPPRLAGMVSGFADSAAGLIRPAVEKALADAGKDGVSGLSAAELLAPLATLGAGVCAYCPRCGDGFLRADGQCPRGVNLRPIDRSGGGS
jgi:hypothetical protein